MSASFYILRSEDFQCKYAQAGDILQKLGPMVYTLFALLYVHHSGYGVAL